MRSTRTLALVVAAGLVASGCGGGLSRQSADNAKAERLAGAPPNATVGAGPFESDLAFLRQNTEVIVLAEPGGAAQVVVSPEYQGRVMTSTTGGSDAPSFGWIGRAAIGARAKQPHINVFGGEDRFWLGPEGGQFSLYFKKGDAFDLEHWQVPEAFDWGKWDVDSQTPTSVRFRKRMSLVNYSGASFDLEVDRTVRMLSAPEVEKHFGTSAGSAVRMVAFESSNTVTNVGREPWQPVSGLVSVWILGMFTPSPETTIAIPFASGPESTRGPIVNDAYFGKVPSERLRVSESAIFFKGDGQYRSKIGLSPSRALSFAGSYDAARRVLTLVQYTRPAGRHAIRELDVGGAARALQGRRHQQLQRRAARAWETTARPVLRARNVFAGPESFTRSGLYARASHGSRGRPRGRSRRAGSSHAESRPGRNREGFLVLTSHTVQMFLFSPR